MLESLYESLRFPIRGRVVRCGTNVLYAVLLETTSNSLEVNCVLLSLTSCSGNPCEENSFRSSVIVCSEVVVDIGTTSNHLEWASMTTKTMVQIWALQSLHGFVTKA